MPSFPEPSSPSTFTKRHGVSTPRRLEYTLEFAMEFVLAALNYRILIQPCYLRSALFWDITQCTLVTPYQLFGTIYQPHHQYILTLEDGTDLLSRNVGKELPPCAA